MKTKSILLSMLSVLALSSCNKDVAPNNDTIESGLPTYASLSIDMNNQSGSKAATPADVNAVPVEQKINTVTVYIFEGTTLDATGTITLDASNKGTTAIQTTTGKKKIYAVINNKGTAPVVIPGRTTIAELKTALTYTYGADIADGTSTGNFVMMGEVETVLAPHTQVEAIANPITINVDRVSAKVSLVYNKATVKLVGIGGTIDGDNVNYSLMQTHKQVDILHPANGYVFTLPTTHLDAAPADGTYDHLNRFDPKNAAFVYKTAQQTFANAILFVNSEYCAENINETPTTGNVTYVLVKLKYTPVAGDFKGATTAPEGDGSFYVVTIPATGVQNIYGTQAEAELDPAYNATTNKVSKHEGGVCYYRLNIRDRAFTTAEMTKRYSVLRNHVYRVDIQNVNGVGAGDPSDLIPIDPTTPVETTAYMSADIIVNAWVPVDMSEDLQ